MLFANLNNIQAGCPAAEAHVRKLPLRPQRTELGSSSLSSQTQSPPQLKHSLDGHTTTSTRSTSPFIKRTLTSPLMPSPQRQKAIPPFSHYGLSPCSVPGMLLGDTSVAKTDKGPIPRKVFHSNWKANSTKQT